MDLTCPGCHTEYDTIEREPQNLSCGCDLCLMCVEERRGDGACPEGHKVDWGRVTVSRRVLKMVQAALFACPTHKGRPYDFWCPTCRVPLCGICAVSHKDICLRAGGGGIGSSNPTFYLIEMGNPNASEELIRYAQEHTKSIEQSAADLEEAIPASLLRTPDQFAAFVQGKALEAVQNFYANLEKSVGEMYERFNKEHQAAIKEEEKRDHAIMQLAEVKENIEGAVMELNVAVKNFREAEKEEKKAKDQEQQQQDAQNKQKKNSSSAENTENNQAPPPPQQNQSPSSSTEKSKLRHQASSEMCSKAGQLASLLQKLIEEQNNGNLKGSVSCSTIKQLAEVNVMSLEALHPRWDTADPPARSCPLYRGVLRANSNAARSAGYGGTTYHGESTSFYNSQQQDASSIYLQQQPSANNNRSTGNIYSSSSLSRFGNNGASSVNGPATNGPRSSSYEARDVSPNSQRRPRLMESLWREQVRHEINISTSSSGSGVNAEKSNYSPPSSRLTQSQSGPMISPGGSGSVSRSSQRY